MAVFSDYHCTPVVTAAPGHETGLAGAVQNSSAQQVMTCQETVSPHSGVVNSSALGRGGLQGLGYSVQQLGGPQGIPERPLLGKWSKAPHQGAQSVGQAVPPQGGITVNGYHQQIMYPKLPPVMTSWSYPKSMSKTQTMNTTGVGVIGIAVLQGAVGAMTMHHLTALPKDLISSTSFQSQSSPNAFTPNATSQSNSNTFTPNFQSQGSHNAFTPNFQSKGSYNAFISNNNQNPPSMSQINFDLGQYVGYRIQRGILRNGVFSEMNYTEHINIHWVMNPQVINEWD